MKKLRTVIIGMGKMGKIRYIALIKHGGFEIVALCDIKEDNLEGYEENKYISWKECLDQINPDCVIVCTYNLYITEIVCYSLEKGIHVFAEKPPGKDLNDALKMQDADENSTAILKFGFNHRYHNSIMEAKALINSGILGEIVCARGVYGKAGQPNFHQEWRNNKELSGGGILIDQGIHMIDLLQYFLGDFITIKSKVAHLVWEELNTEDSAFAILETKKGQIASLHSSAVQWKHKFDLDLLCSNGYIALNGLLTATQSYGEETLTYYKKDLAGKAGKLGKPLEHTLCFGTDESWDLEMNEFYEVIDKKVSPTHGSSQQAAKVMALVEKIYEKGM